MDLLPSILLLLVIGGAFAEDSTPALPELIEQVVERLQAPLTLYVDELPSIPKIYGYSLFDSRPTPVNLTIGMYQTTWKFHRDMPNTTVFAFGTTAAAASFPGPTIEALRAVPLWVTWENHLPSTHILPWDPTIHVARPRHGAGVPTVVHLHGGVVAPADDGYADAWFTSGFADTGPNWTKPNYLYPNVQGAGNLMYHDHTFGLTRVNILAGLVGAYIIRDPVREGRYNLPNGSFDLELLIADRIFATDGSIYMNATGRVPEVHPQWRAEYFGQVITVNGKAWPYLTVRRRRYRFRIMNVSNARYYNLTLSGGRLPFFVIGSDGSYLARPVATRSILLSVAEIFDVIVDFSATNATEIELLNHAPYPYRPTGTAVEGTDLGRVMKFVIRQTPTRIPANRAPILPTSLIDYATAIEDEATTTRYIAFYEYFRSGHITHLLINGKNVTDPVTETPKTGSTEVWHVINLTGDDHPLHIHVATFQAVRTTELVDVGNFTACMQRLSDPAACDIAAHAVGSVTYPPEYERTWKNVAKMPPSTMTTIVAKFRIAETDQAFPFDATAEPGYFYHCHILDHEDNVMIRPLKLIP
ncbi:multicopper oxidase LPR1 homolog 1-like [Curcuma longa]|uniref:multicopper oxidase LPR1 homolog 1-like n=1 Tax=Curcuma longa TaxID=136217 RepID=UPI003D9EE2B6